MKKKLLVGILVLTMLVACLAVSASAEAALGSNGNPITTAEQLVTYLGSGNAENKKIRGF